MHKVFLSFHSVDIAYKNHFEKLFHNSICISQSVDTGDISTGIQTETVRQRIRDEYLRDTSVTIVLVGPYTWQRKHVDWEISSSLRDTTYNPRSGLLGILLPNYPGYTTNSYNKYTIPPRLYDNVACEYAQLQRWTEDPVTVQGWVRKAYLTKAQWLPDNSYPSFANNRSGERWY